MNSSNTEQVGQQAHLSGYRLDNLTVAKGPNGSHTAHTSKP